MTKTCWTARSWATKITCWNYLAMASMKIQISQVSGKKTPPSPSFFPNGGHLTLEKGHLKRPKRSLGRNHLQFLLLKPFNVGLPSLKVHPPCLNHQKINWKMGLTIWEGFQLENVKHGNIWWSIASGWFRKNIIQRHCIVVRVASSDIWRKFQTNTCIWFIDIDMHICLERWQFVDCWQDCDEYQNDPFAFVFVCGEFDAK